MPIYTMKVFCCCYCCLRHSLAIVAQACLALLDPPISDTLFKTSFSLVLCKRPNGLNNFHATMKAFLTK